MPRKARVIIPNTPHHVMQRGHNRQVVFSSEEEFQYYRENLILYKKQFSCKVYAYCLMTNHVHLIVNPGNNPESLSLLMKRLAGRQTRYVNTLEKRSGSLWEGRFKSSIISSKEYLLACCRYIDLNPLRAGLVNDPKDYLWSGYNSKVEGIVDKVLDLDSNYRALGNTQKERQSAYKEYVTQTIPDEELHLIRLAIQRNQLTGSDRFRMYLEKKHKVVISNRGQGRPKKAKK
jgi:putative transposase